MSSSKPKSTSTKNHELLGRSLNIFNLIVKPFVKFHIKLHLGPNWEAKFKLDAVSAGKSFGLITSDASKKIIFDTQVILSALKLYWNEIFISIFQNVATNSVASSDNEIGEVFFENMRPLVFEMGEIRNKWAHFIKMSTRETHRSVETIDQICKVVFIHTEKMQKKAVEQEQQHQPPQIPIQIFPNPQTQNFSNFQENYQDFNGECQEYQGEEEEYYNDDYYDEDAPNHTQPFSQTKGNTPITYLNTKAPIPPKTAIPVANKQQKRPQRVFDDATFESFKNDCNKAFRDLNNIQNFLVKQRNHEISLEERDKMMRMDIEDN